MKNKRLEIVTCRLAGGGGGGARARVPPSPARSGPGVCLLRKLALSVTIKYRAKSSDLN